MMGICCGRGGLWLRSRQVEQLMGLRNVLLALRTGEQAIVANAAYCTLRADHLTRVPAGLDAAEAAAVGTTLPRAYRIRTCKRHFGKCRLDCRADCA